MKMVEAKLPDLALKDDFFFWCGVVSLPLDITT